MNWSDEHYVKLYTRDSLTWKSWHWEARTVFLHLLRKLDGSGFIETGTMSTVSALTIQLELPAAVVEAGLEQLVACGTCEVVDRAILLVKFTEAQDARKTEAQKKRDFRERTIVRRRQAAATTTPHVPTMEPVGTQVDPPAKLSPAQLSPKRPVAKKPATPSDPRLHPLQLALEAEFLSVRGSKYLHGGGKDGDALKSLLPIATDEEIRARWAKTLRVPTGWLNSSTFAQLRSKWNDLAGPAAPIKASDVREPPPRSAEESKRYMAELREKQGWDR